MHFAIKEFGYIYRGDHNTQSVESITLSQQNFDFFKSAITPISNEYNQVLKSCLKNGQEALQVGNHVGVLQSPYGAIIEILPKTATAPITKDTLPEERKILISMLSEILLPVPKTPSTTFLVTGRIPLLEALVGFYIEVVQDLVKAGLRSDFLETDVEDTFLRGKLDIKKQVNASYKTQPYLYMICDQLSKDIPQNRLIKACLCYLLELIHNQSQRKLLKELLVHFSSVKLPHAPMREFALCAHDRRMKHYDIALQWSDMLLQGLSTTPSFGTNRSLSLLFPMEKIFELFVTQQIKTQYKNWSIEAQTSDHFLVNNHNGSPKFSMRPDLLVSTPSALIVADIKWKKIDVTAKNYGITRSDLYQIYSYGHKIICNQFKKIAMLIYPTHQNFHNPLPPFCFEDGFVLYILPFDIHKGTLIIHPDLKHHVKKNPL